MFLKYKKILILKNKKTFNFFKNSFKIQKNSITKPPPMIVLFFNIIFRT